MSPREMTSDELNAELWHQIVNRGQSAHIEGGPVGSKHEGTDVLYVNGRAVALAPIEAAA